MEDGKLTVTQNSQSNKCTISGYTSDSPTKNVPLSQSGALKWQWQFEFSASSRSLSFSSDGGSKSTTITSRRRMIYINDSGSATGNLGNWESCDFSVSESLSWITTSTSGNTVSFNASENTSTSRSGSATIEQSRSGYYQYTGSDYPSDSGSISISLSQDAATVNTYYQYKFSASPTSLSYSYDSTDESKSTTVTSQRRSVTVTNGSVSSTGSYTTWSSWSGALTNNQDNAFSKVDNDTVKVTKTNPSQTSSRVGVFTLTQTQTSNCTISGYESDSSTIDISLNQLPAPRTPDCYIHNNIDPIRPIWAFSSSRQPNGSLSVYQNKTERNFPAMLGGSTYAWYSDKGVDVFDPETNGGTTHLNLGDWIYFRGSENSGAYWTNAAGTRLDHSIYLNTLNLGG